MAIDADLVSAAVSGSRTWRLEYWDALIVTAASSTGCTRLFTEDLADGADFGGVRVVNPFASGARVAEERAAYGPESGPWDDDALTAGLARYEQACRDAGMRPNAIHSY